MSKRTHNGVFSNLERLVVLGTDTMTPKQRDKYIRDKIKILYKDFLIPLSEEDKKYLYSLESKRAIDVAVSKIIKERL